MSNWYQFETRSNQLLRRHYILFHFSKQHYTVVKVYNVFCRFLYQVAAAEGATTYANVHPV